MKRRQSTANQSVTQAEFESAMTAIKQDFNQVDDRFDRIEGRLEGVEGRLDRVEGRLGRVEKLQEKTLRIQEATFTVVQSIEGRLTKMADHEERIQRYEIGQLR